MGPLETDAFPEKPWRPSVKSFVRRCCFVGFSVGHSGLCLAEEGGSNGAIGSGAVPRDSCETVRGTTLVDDVALFETGGSKGAIGSKGIPREVCEIVRGTSQYKMLCCFD